MPFSQTVESGIGPTVNTIAKGSVIVTVD